MKSDDEQNLGVAGLRANNPEAELVAIKSCINTLFKKYKKKAETARESATVANKKGARARWRKLCSDAQIYEKMAANLVLIDSPL